MVILLDTDIGADSDDAVALGYLAKQVEKGRCRLPLVTLCTARNGAAGCVRAILGKVAPSVRIGRMRAPLPCDGYDCYAMEVCTAFGADDRAEDALECWRELYRAAEEKIVVITIGPLTNLALFMREESALFAQKTECVYLMAGRFDAPIGEWNIEQDIPSAIYVAGHMPCEAFILPFEVGCRALTGRTFIGRRDTSIGTCLYLYAEHDRGSCENIMRESWDPFTVLCAFHPELFTFSDFGNLLIDMDGVASFSFSDAGRFRMLGVKDAAKAAQAVEEELDGGAGAMFSFLS